MFHTTTYTHTYKLIRYLIIKHTSLHYITCILDCRFYYSIFAFNVLLFWFASRPLSIAWKHADQSLKALQIPNKNTTKLIFKMYLPLWPCMRAWRIIIIRDVNFDHFNTHIYIAATTTTTAIATCCCCCCCCYTVSFPLFSLDFACGSSFKFCMAIYFNRNHFCWFNEGYFFPFSRLLYKQNKTRHKRYNQVDTDFIYAMWVLWLSEKYKS